MFEVVETQYKVNKNGYDYKVFYKEDSGVIFRRKEGMVDIPPTNEVFTENGWCPVINNGIPIHHFKYLDEIEELVKLDN